MWLCEEKVKGKQLTSGCRPRLKNERAYAHQQNKAEKRKKSEKVVNLRHSMPCHRNMKLSVVTVQLLLKTFWKV